MVRRSALDFVSYDRANLKEEAFYGVQGNTRYYSVVHFVKGYNFDNGGCYDTYFIVNENEIVHFNDADKALEYTQKEFSNMFPKYVIDK